MNNLDRKNDNPFFRAFEKAISQKDWKKEMLCSPEDFLVKIAQDIDRQYIEEEENGKPKIIVRDNKESERLVREQRKDY